MELRDFVSTPIILVVVYVVAFLLRPYVTDQLTRQYFIPALTVRVFGALALGVVYQFYYDGGDTYNYHTGGSRIIWEAFMKDPLAGMQLIFQPVTNNQNLYEYTSRIYFARDPNSYFVIRIAALFDIFTFSSYSGTAILFSVVGFVGAWLFFITFYRQFSEAHRGLAFATLFIPSVFFWGSGVMKDTIVLAGVGVATFSIYKIFIEKQRQVLYTFLLFVSLFLIYSIRIFVLQAFVPAILVWLFLIRMQSIRMVLVRILMVPFVAVALGVSVYYSVQQLGQSSKYSLDNIVKTAAVTAYDIGYFTGRNAGSGYSVEVTEWTPLGMLQAAPAAINVSLFRPYLWEVRNPLMLISALESTFILVFTVIILLRGFGRLSSALTSYNVVFCLVFALIFSFAAGISTFNFGTLTRYRIVALPFYVVALVLLEYYSSSKRRNRGVLETTE
ncbi:MAG: hypothetical protein U0289_12440 [Cyclobacteriaceae bacterium]|nr:hypothetical protein [Cytophagales bacterium]HNP76702.1 hypothetical protein [Cyclobacteriaceae bacterium]